MAVFIDSATVDETLNSCTMLQTVLVQLSFMYIGR